MENTNAFSTISKTAILLTTLFYLVCWYFKRNSQPIKSRGIVPPICLLCFGVAVTSQLVEPIIHPERGVKPPYCFIIAFGDFPFYVAITLMMVLQAFRYFFIKNINKFKNSIRPTFGPNRKSQNIEARLSLNITPTMRFRVFQVLASPKFTIAVLIILWVIWYPVTILLSIFTGCPLSDGVMFTPFIAFYVALLVIIYLSAVIIWAQDVIQNFKIACKRPWMFFVMDDPHLFRIEFILFICFTIWSFVCPILLPLWNTKNIIWLHDLNVFQILVFESFVIFGFLLLMTILREYSKTGTDTEKSESDLDLVLSNPELCKKFYEYAQKEWSVENVLLHKDIETYKMIQRRSKRKELAKCIYQEYLSTTATLEANVPRRYANAVLARINGDRMDDDLFDEVQTVVRLNLQDTLSRFQKTEEYKTYMSNLMMQDKYMRDAGLK